jgi:predicted Zn-dependent protease
MKRIEAAKRIVGMVLAGCLLALGAGKATAAIWVSEKEIMREARVQWLQMKKSLPPAPDARVQRYVECIANRIINVLPEEHANLSWEVVVFDDESTNAFAMPGGKVGVFTGIFKVADTPDSLAAVIGHEIAHLTEDHVMERARRESRTDMLVIMGSAATGIGSDVLRQGAAIGLNLPFSRNQESQADVVGLDYMARAGFDPRATIYLWKNMGAASQGDPPEFLSTHPSDDRRLDDLVKSLTPALVTYNEAQTNGRRPNCAMP